MQTAKEFIAEDHTIPEGKWAFDESVTQVFDNMLERSIPQYKEMRNLTYDMAIHYAVRDTAIIDLGCSRGEAMSRLIDHFGCNNQFIGVEISPHMLTAVRERFEGLRKSGVVSILEMDLRNEYPPYRASVTLCVLTLQFTPIEYRLQILDNIYKSLLPGGALLLVEKVIGSTAHINKAMVDRYHLMKARNGYTQEEIERKRMSLEGVLVPLTARMNEEQLYVAGFKEVDCYWRWLNFAAWVAIKGTHTHS